MSSTSRWVSWVYVATIAALAAASFDSRHNTFTPFPEGLMFVLLLPVLPVALPAIYLGGAFVWSLTDADTGGPMWPVTVLYVLMFTSVAVANVALVRWLAAWWRRRPAPSTTPSTTPSANPSSTVTSPGRVRGGGGQS